MSKVARRTVSSQKPLACKLAIIALPGRRGTSEIYLHVRSKADSIRISKEPGPRPPLSHPLHHPNGLARKVLSRETPRRMQFPQGAGFEGRRW